MIVLNKSVINGVPVAQTFNVTGNEIFIYDIITSSSFGSDDPSITPDRFTEQIQSMSGDITIKINSNGGSVGPALTIFNTIKQYDRGEVTSIVMGYAFSSAGWLPMAADKRYIAEGGIFMLHDPYFIDIIDSAKSLDRVRNIWETHHKTVVNIFESATKNSRDQIVEWMANETYMDENEAVENGFFEKLPDQKADYGVLSSLTPENLKSLPENLKSRILENRAKNIQKQIMEMRNRASRIFV